MSDLADNGNDALQRGRPLDVGIDAHETDRVCNGGRGDDAGRHVRDF